MLRGVSWVLLLLLFEGVCRAGGNSCGWDWCWCWLNGCRSLGCTEG